MPAGFEEGAASASVDAHRALNARHRRIAAAWWQSDPLADLVTARLVGPSDFLCSRIMMTISTFDNLRRVRHF